ncbi:hypothetical protein DPMN_114947 [Dreissena polymorpha]|uniref:Uncharacterized protein n=1 Tax=Dreissena polymorpha TaxID=45954 RepID=A0A9D4QSH9_DREPO|nr:hypothetical protein DPMN_114947 [Dreissena polymorpha]
MTIFVEHICMPLVDVGLFKSNKCCEISTVYMPLHNLCLDSNVPLREEFVGNVMEPEVMNNTPVHGAACDKRQQLIKLFHKKMLKNYSYKCYKVIDALSLL